MDRDEALAAKTWDNAERLSPANPIVEGRGAFVRDPAHRFPGRRHALKVL